MAQLVLYTIAAFIVGEYLLERVLNYLNSQNWRSEVPEELEEIYDNEDYQQSQEYDKAQASLSLRTSTFNLVVILLMLFLGGFAYLDSIIRQWAQHPIVMNLLFFGILGLGADFINLPFSIYHTFVIEEKFGFNRMSVGTFISDKVKGYLLGGLIGGALLSVFVWFYLQTPQYFWLWIWVIFTLFTLFFTMFYTSWIVPLFNKLTPLEEGELRKAIEEYCEKVDFPLNDIYVMDGSKRSSKANAYFSGLGRKKSIVLFDTLIEKHSTEELVSILAHEVGHYKKKHIYKTFGLSSLQMLLMLFIFSLLVDSPVLAQALGIEQVSPEPGAYFHLGLLAFMLLYTPISLLTGILMNKFSWKNEYEADQFARKTYDSQPLREALKKLSVDHLSNAHPHPAYVFFHYTHPPLLKRLEALKQ